ncbi:glycosyltransferase [Paenibacillus glycinis]|uniref:Glycosyltransferase n=1 Tax=Paenibacillus glycinis TaxID=2697035 RepID=A0ABW9XX61_9BACL|nr:glycosyltransferase [Paenibacillus glycinis]NBD27307.1 glycosyltransferase [Paenibacillus glycinis]
MSLNATPLLTTYLFVADGIPRDRLQALIKRLEDGHLTVALHEADDAQPTDGRLPAPRVYVSLGDAWERFAALVALPLHEKKRWLHFQSPDDVQPENVFYCWLKATDPLPVNRTIPPVRFASDSPLVSVFTASYRSRDKILRPYRSLLKQTYANWEWVIVDDSGDDDETYRQDLLPLEDRRVRRYRQDARNGYIGAIKRYAAGLCTGEILVEVDHDDELAPDCLEKIVQAFRSHPECGFVYGDCAEVYADSRHAHWYGWDCGFGYSVHYRVWLPEMNRWQNAQRHTTVNASTIRHLVGLPNHPRAWTRDCYHLIGGHRDELLVSDDYDMLVRTFLCTRFAAIPDLLYIQYRNEHGNNTTFLRNKQIQVLVKELNRSYQSRIQTRLQELDLPVTLAYSRIWERPGNDPARKTAHILDEDPTGVSLLFPIPYSGAEEAHAELSKTLRKGEENGFDGLEVVVVGRIPAEVEAHAARAPMGAIRWWPMEPSDGMEACIQYAKLIASCKEKIVILP